MWGDTETEMRVTVIEAYADFCSIDVYDSQEQKQSESDSYLIEKGDFRTMWLNFTIDN